MSVTPQPPHQSLAADQASAIARQDPSLAGSDADSGSHSQNNGSSTDGPAGQKDVNFADQTDKVAVAGVASTVAGINAPEQKGVPVEPEDDEDEDEDDDDDDDFIPRGGPSRPTGAGGNNGNKPVRAR